MTGKLIRTLSYSGTTASRQVVIADPSVAVIAALDAVVRVPYGEHMEFIGSLTGGVLLPRLRAPNSLEANPGRAPTHRP